MELYEIELVRRKCYRIKIAADNEMDARMLAQSHSHVFDESCLSDAESFDLYYASSLSSDSYSE